MTDKAFLAFALAFGILSARPAHADVNIGVTIGAPPPAVLVSAPPAVVIIPGTAVYHAPSASFNLFVFGGRYYSLHHGTWFLAVGPGAPWTVIAAQQVPPAVLGVPVTYYKIPPGHARRAGFAPSGPGHPGRGPRK
jgi:hypothetical protein